MLQNEQLDHAVRVAVSDVVFRVNAACLHIICSNIVILCCIVLHFIALHCIVLYCIFLYCIVLYCTCIYLIQYITMQCNVMQYKTVQYKTIQYKTIQDNTMQCNAMQCKTILYIYYCRPHADVSIYSKNYLKDCNSYCIIYLFIWKNSSTFNPFFFDTSRTEGSLLRICCF